MTKLVLVILGCLLCQGIVSDASAQDLAAKGNALAATLDKTKYKTKEKRGFKVELYLDVKNEPVVKPNIADYSGIYSDDSSNHRLLLNISSDGRIMGSGYDGGIDGRRQNFTLEDTRIEGAVLTATKVYANGRTEKVEAVFADRTVRSGQNEKSVATVDKQFGIGYVTNNGQWTSRVFLKRE